MPRLFFRRGKKKKIDRDISIRTASATLLYEEQQLQQQQGTFVSATDWIDHTLRYRHDNNNNNNNSVNNMDLHVNVPDHHHNNHHPSSDNTATTTTTTNIPKQYYYNNRQIPSQSQLLPSQPPSFLSPENVASIPPPGLSAPSQPIFITIPIDNVTNSDQQKQQVSSPPKERIILTYVTVQPKSSYPSIHKGRTSNGNGGGGTTSSSSSNSSNGTRSLYRPLTTSLGLSSLNGNNNNNTMNTNSNQSTSSITSTNNNNNSTNQPLSTSTTTTSTTSSSNTSNNLTERVLMCCDITSNSHKNQNHNKNMDTNTANSSNNKSTTKQSVPLLRWHTSNLSSLLVNRTTTKTTTATSGNNTNTCNNTNTSKRRALPTTITESGTNSSNNSSHSCSTGTSSTISNNHIATIESTQQLSSIITTSTRTPITTPTSIPLEERLLRERLKVVSNSKASSGSLTQFHYAKVVQPANDDSNNTTNNDTKTPEQMDETPSNTSRSHVRLLIPARGSLYIQDGIDLINEQTNNKGNKNIDPSIRNENYNSNNNHHNSNVRCICIHDKTASNMSATDAQLSPDGTMIAWTHEGEIYVQSAEPRTFDTSLLQNIDTSSFAIDDSFITAATSTTTPPVRISYGACQTETCCITHGVADFVAQEEMDRYRGFWWHPNSNAILFTRNDESNVPIYRIMHQSNSSTIPSFSSSGNNSHQQHTDHSSSQHYESNNSSSCNGLFTPSKNMNTSEFEDHRYPFAGKMNPSVKLGLVQIDRNSVLDLANTSKASTVPQKVTTSVCIEQRDGIEGDETSTSFYVENDIADNKKNEDDSNDPMNITTSEDIAAENWSNCIYFNAPIEANEYLARVHILPDGRVIAQWQNRAQTCSILYLLDMNQSTFVSSDTTTNRMGSVVDGQLLVTERSDIWINLHHMFHLLPRPIHPKEYITDESIANESRPGIDMPFPLPVGSFSFIFASERTGYCHLYLYTYCPGFNQNEAVLIRPLTSGNWTVENILGVDLAKDVVYFAGTLDSVLERHLYALPILNLRNKHTWRFGSYPTTVPPTSETQSSDDISISQTPFNSPATILDESANHMLTNGGVRRGLSKVMHALSGKGNNSSTVDYIGPTNSSEHFEIFLTKSSIGENSCLTTPTRLTLESGMHSIVMDDKCRYFVDTSSDVDRPTSVKIYELPTDDRMTVCWNATIYDATYDDLFAASTTNVSNEYKTNGKLDMVKCLPPPEMISFPTSDGKETLHAALYRPNPQLFGSGPHPLVCAVYGGPHVQRVNKSWSQSADMRAQRLRSLGFCVVKCDNRGSSRRGLAFESAISRRLGRIEVLDQVAAVRQLVVRGIVDPSRVGVYGWSYGGYLSAMCLCRAPDVFHVAVAGAPVTSWDGYDTHYTERYMGLPTENPSGYRESAVFDHVPNMRGKLMIVHGLIDENVHFRHTTRLINKLIAAGKDYDLLIFPEERHSPRRLRDRIYMEQRISEYFVRHLQPRDDIQAKGSEAVVGIYENNNGQGLRPMAGHL